MPHNWTAQEIDDILNGKAGFSEGGGITYFDQNAKRNTQAYNDGYAEGVHDGVATGKLYAEEAAKAQIFSLQSEKEGLAIVASFVPILVITIIVLSVALFRRRKGFEQRVAEKQSREVSVNMRLRSSPLSVKLLRFLAKYFLPFCAFVQLMIIVGNYSIFDFKTAIVTSPYLLVLEVSIDLSMLSLLVSLAILLKRLHRYCLSMIHTLLLLTTFSYAYNNCFSTMWYPATAFCILFAARFFVVSFPLMAYFQKRAYLFDKDEPFPNNLMMSAKTKLRITQLVLLAFVVGGVGAFIVYPLDIQSVEQSPVPQSGMPVVAASQASPARVSTSGTAAIPFVASSKSKKCRPLCCKRIEGM